MADDIDWTSLAANVLPAVVGAMGGARRGGIGAIPGALYGAGSSARYSIESDLERDRLNTEIAFKNQQQQAVQQRIEQENRQLDMQSRNYDRLNRVADEQIKNYGLERQKHQMEIDAATRSVEGQARFRESLPPEKQVIFDADPNKQQYIHEYYKEKDWEAKTNSSAALLKTMGLDSETARMLGPTGTSHLLGSIMESRNKPRENFAFHYVPETGHVLSYNKTTNEIIDKGTFGPPKGASPEKRSQVEAGLRAMWKLQQPALAKLYEDDEDKAMSAFNSWRTTQEGEISEKFLYGEMTPAEHRGALGSLKRQESQVNEDATQMMKEAYLKTDPKNRWYNRATPQTEAGFNEFLQSKDGKTRLEEYKKAVRKSGGPTAAAASANAAADLDYAKKNNTSLAGRKNAEAPAAQQQIPTDPVERQKFIREHMGFGGK